MEQTVEYFNQSHLVQNVLQGKVSEGLPNKFEEIDLRFLRALRFSDTWAGDDAPDTGDDCLVIMYGNQVAYQRVKFYFNGEQQTRYEEGEKLYDELYNPSQLYLKILFVAGALFNREKLKEGADTFYVSERDLACIKGHPQFKEMVRDLGLELRSVSEKGKMQVVVTKFFERTRKQEV